jgi:hypothetical protein
MFLHNLLKVLVQIANKMGLQKKCTNLSRLQRERNTVESDWQKTDQTSRQRGRPTETTQQRSDRI